MPHQRYPKAGTGAWQTLLRMPIADSERLPKQDVGRGLTSTLLHRNLEDEDTQHEATAKISKNLLGQAGQTTSEIGNTLA